MQEIIEKINFIKIKLEYRPLLTGIAASNHFVGRYYAFFCHNNRVHTFQLSWPAVTGIPGPHELLHWAYKLHDLVIYTSCTRLQPGECGAVPQSVTPKTWGSWCNYYGRCKPGESHDVATAPCFGVTACGAMFRSWEQYLVSRSHRKQIRRDRWSTTAFLGAAVSRWKAICFHCLLLPPKPRPVRGRLSQFLPPSNFMFY